MRGTGRIMPTMAIEPFILQMVTNIKANGKVVNMMVMVLLQI